MPQPNARIEKQILLSPSGRKFVQNPGQTILEAGLAAGISLPYRCSNGSCGECLARIIKGATCKSRHHDFVVAESDRLRGDFLMCSHAATEDTEIEVMESTSVAEIPRQSLQAKVCHHEYADNILLLSLKFTRGTALRFLPGQFVQLGVPGSAPAVLPISSCPCESTTIEFHLLNKRSDAALNRANANSELSLSQSLITLKSRDRIRIQGPFGGISLADKPTSPQLFLAIGIDFRVLQGLIEQLFNLEAESPIGLLWLSTDKVTQYRSNLCRSWADAIDNFTYLAADSLSTLLEKMDTGFVEVFKNATVYRVGAETDLLESILRLGLQPGSIIDLDDPINS